MNCFDSIYPVTNVQWILSKLNTQRGYLRLTSTISAIKQSIFDLQTTVGQHINFPTTQTPENNNFVWVELITATKGNALL